MFMSVSFFFFILKYKKVQLLNLNKSPVTLRHITNNPFPKTDISMSVFSAAMSQPDHEQLKSKADRYFSRPHNKEEKKKQKSEWKRRQREKKVRQKRAERQKRRARGKEAKRDVEDVIFAQRNFPSEKDAEATLMQKPLVDLGDKRDSQAALQFEKNGEAENAEKAAEAVREGRRRDKVHGLERSRGRQMLALSLKRKRPEISTKLDEQPRVFSKSARARMSTRATITIPDQKNLPMVREICSSLLIKTSADEPIGSGTFGTVYLAEYRGMKTAVKEIKKRKNTHEETERCRREVLHEARILQSLGEHQNIPFLFGICTKMEPFCLVLQFYGIGGKSTTLHEALKNRRLKKNSTARVFYEIAETLKYMHNKSILHNDLKTNNVLMQQGNSGELHPILIDFGKSRAIAKAKGYRRGDVDYLAPEVKAGKRESTQSDIFSFGKMLEAAVRGRSFLPAFSELITSTTAVDASKRPSVIEVAQELTKFCR